MDARSLRRITRDLEMGFQSKVCVGGLIFRVCFDRAYRVVDLTASSPKFGGFVSATSDQQEIGERDTILKTECILIAKRILARLITKEMNKFKDLLYPKA